MYDRCLLPSWKSPERSKMCRSQSSLNSGGKGVTLPERCRGFSSGYGTFQKTGWIIIAEPLVPHTSLFFCPLSFFGTLPFGSLFQRLCTHGFYTDMHCQTCTHTHTHADNSPRVSLMSCVRILLFSAFLSDLRLLQGSSVPT